MSEGLDRDELDRMFFAECEDFLHSAESVLGLEGPDAAGDEGLDVLGRCAHSLKGASLTLGFTGLGALASALDRCLAGARESGFEPDWALLREGFAAVRFNLAGLRGGAGKALGSSPDLLERLEASNAADPLVYRIFVFRLSAMGVASPVLFDDMLANLRKHAGVMVLQSPWDAPGRVCRLECRSACVEQTLMEIIERVAEPGSVTLELGAGQGDVREGGQDAFALTSGSPFADETALSSPAACVAFSVGSRRFAADAKGIEEIRCGDPMHPPFGGSALVCGTIEIDGAFLPVIDLQQCLKLGSGRVRTSSMQLVSRLAGEAVAALVDDVEEIFTVPPEDIQPVAGVLAHDLPGGVRGLVKQDGEAVWLIDLPCLLAACLGRNDAH